MKNEKLLTRLHDLGLLSPKDHEVTQIFNAIKADDLQGVKQPTYKHWRSKANGNFYWHCIAGNGEIIFQGEPDGYSSKQECLNAIDRCKRYARWGNVVEAA